jgi:hypothetical protein
MTAVVKGINVLEPPLDVNSHALSETGVKTKKKKKKEEKR